MSPIQISNLLQTGAEQQVRSYLKKLGIRERMRVLHTVIPYVNATPKTLKFFHTNFSMEIGAIISSNFDYDKAAQLYNDAKGK